MNHEIKHMLGGYLLETIKRKIRRSYTSNEFKSHGKYHTSPFSSFPLFFPRKIFYPLLSFLSKNPAPTPLLQPAFPLKIQLPKPSPLTAAPLLLLFSVAAFLPFFSPVGSYLLGQAITCFPVSAVSSLASFISSMTSLAVGPTHGEGSPPHLSGAASSSNIYKKN